MEDLDTSTISFWASRSAYLRDLERNTVINLAQETLRTRGIGQLDSITNCLETSGNFFLMCSSPIAVGRIEYGDSIYLHYDVEGEELLAVIPKKKLKANLCIRSGCLEVPDKKKIFCLNHTEICVEEVVNANGSVQAYFVWSKEEERRLRIEEFNNRVGPNSHHYTLRKKLLEELIQTIVSNAVNRASRIQLVMGDNLNANQLSNLEACLKLKVYSTKFVSLGWDPVIDKPIYRFVDERIWKKLCSGSSDKSPCLNPVTPNSDYCPSHGPRKRESVVIAKILELSEVDYAHLLSEESYEVLCENLSKLWNCMTDIDGVRTQIRLDRQTDDSTFIRVLEYKDNSTVPEVKTVCPNLFRGFECNKIFTKHCANCDDRGLGYTVYILRPIYNGRPELRNVFVIQIAINRKRGGASVNAENFKARLEDFGHSTEYDHIKICMAKFADTKEDALELKTACVYYLQIEGHCAQERVHVCVSLSPLGNFPVRRLQTLLSEIGLKLIPVTHAVDISKFPEGLRTFHYVNSTEDVRRDIVIARIYQISARGCTSVYNGIDHLTGKPGKSLDVRHHDTIKNDKTMARKIPMENRIIKTLVTIPCSESSVRASNLGVETLIFTAYKFAAEIHDFTVENQVNVNSSSYYWNWYWFVEMQLFQQKHFGFHTKLVSINDETKKEVKLVGSTGIKAT